MVLLLRPEEVPKDLICAICMSVPIDPCFTKLCDHVFCPQCISVSLGHQANCPVCRRACSPYNVSCMEEGSLIYRIWSSIMIKCDNHEAGCSWTGSIADYENHHSSCDRQAQRIGDRSESDQELIEHLAADNLNLTTRLEASESENARLRRLTAEWEEKHKKLKVEFLEATKALTSALVNQMEVAVPNEKGGYDYDATSVVDLTRLICRNLECKPDDINANKIFECVRKIYMGLKSGHKDNPPNYYIDVRMLFGVCLASTWFTNNQYRNLSNLASEQGWL